jgi:DNA-binding transcriptional MocR family regulator
MTPVPVGPDGMHLDVLRRVIAGAMPAFVYVVPTYQNPTGAVMPEAARRELARLSDETGLVVVEDLTPAIGLGGSRFPRPIGSHATQERVITVGSLSKGGWAGLRLGWIRAERSVISRLIGRKTVADHGTSTLVQAIGARVLEQVDAFEVYAERESAVRREVAGAALRELLPEWSWTEPAGGLSLWVRLPSGDASTFARVAADHGVLVRPGSFASPDGGFRDHIRIAVGEPPERIREGVARLATAWAACAQRRGRPSASVAVSV